MLKLRTPGMGGLLVLMATAGINTAALADPHGTEVARNCAARAQVFLQSLDGEQQKLAGQAFDEAKRRLWSYAPNVPQLTQRLEGVALKDMSEQQRLAAHGLLACGLSSQGYQKSTSIMWLDDILAQTDLYRPMKDLPIGSPFYWLAVFGDPDDDEPWGWQYEGHHLVLNFTVVDNEVIFAPAFMGADPAQVPDGERAGWRILGAEMDKGLTLVRSLSEEQHKHAVIADEIPERIITGQGKGDALKDYAGLPVSDLDAEQLLLFWSLVDEYAGNAADPVAREHLDAIRADGTEDIYFAWMGGTSASSGKYYRIHSPSLIIEFVTARDRQAPGRPPNPNHVHTVFRYPGNDFGTGLLRRHYETSPHHQEK
ncbi:MAG: DUF3500 domain-containing protein [Gammaproteobacteria bacterium]|nr:DUF3500 domain-containing protein [Gammaproteobacteria bacterium]